MRVLVTGFEPFGGDGDNPSADLVATLTPRPELVTAVLPVSYRDIDSTVAECLRRHEPDVVLMVGLAATTIGIRLEQVALNLDDADGADNRGEVRRRRPIDPSGAVACRSGLPLEAIERLAIEHGIPVEWSRDAGGFLCNHVFYVVCGRHRAGPAGFIHIGRSTPVAALAPLFDQIVDRLASA